MRPWIPVVVTFKACAVALALSHHPYAGLVLFFLPDPWLALQFVLPRAQAFGSAATSFATRGREVWLTIDDGPDPASTPHVLELLRAHGARATFFLVGSRVARNPELARRIVADGHSIGNHSHTHPSASFWCATPSRIAEEIDGCVGALLLADAPFERLFRPPVGIRNPFLDPQLAARGMQLVLWSARGYDGISRDPIACLARIASSVRPGAILLAHEGGARTKERLAFMGLLMEHLSREGYACVLPRRDALLFDAKAGPLDIG